MVALLLALTGAISSGAAADANETLKTPLKGPEPGPKGPSLKFGWEAATSRPLCVSSFAGAGKMQCQTVSNSDLGGLAGLWTGELEKVPMYSPTGKDETSHASVLINSSGTTFDIEGGSVSRWTNKTMAVNYPRSCWLSLCVNKENSTGDQHGWVSFIFFRRPLVSVCVFLSFSLSPVSNPLLRRTWLNYNTQTGYWCHSFYITAANKTMFPSLSVMQYSMLAPGSCTAESVEERYKLGEANVLGSIRDNKLNLY